jgi:uncharacterized protein
MLIEFSVGNFLSYKDITKFSMIASSKKEHEDKNVIRINNKLRLLKSSVIYGANASGKSNLFRAMRFMRSFVINSSKETQATEPIKVQNFKLSTETESKPCFFEIIFISKNIKYKYGFEIDKEKVHSEWLFYSPKGKETMLFKRSFQEYEIGLQFKEGKEVKSKTRDNALFLSVAAQFAVPISSDILSWFKDFRIISGINDSFGLYTLKKINDPNFKPKILNFLKIADLGIDDIDAEEIKIDPTTLPDFKIPIPLKSLILKSKNVTTTNVTTVHKKYSNDNTKFEKELFNLNEESQGTQQLLSLAGPIIDTIQTSKVLVIDEMDARLHPLLLEFIVKLFHSIENKSNAQLICVLHNTIILNTATLRRDQIWFAEKDQYGASQLYSLVDFGVRKDASFEKDYILGKYEAIPFLRGEEDLFK